MEIDTQDSQERTNTDLELNENELDDLDTESQNDDHTPDLEQAELPSPEIPQEVKEYLSIEANDIKISIGSCCVNVGSLANIGWGLFSAIKTNGNLKQIKKPSDYIK